MTAQRCSEITFSNSKELGTGLDHYTALPNHMCQLQEAQWPTFETSHGGGAHRGTAPGHTRQGKAFG